MCLWRPEEECVKHFPIGRSIAIVVFALLGIVPTAAAAVKLSTITITPGSVVGGQNATGTATLTTAAGHGGATVTLSSSNTAVATVPANITIPQGSISGTFQVTTFPVAASTSVTITGNLGATATASFTVLPPSVSAIGISPN